MGTFLESEEALKARALEVDLSTAEIQAITAGNVTSLVRLAFAVCPPGQTPTDDQVKSLLGATASPPQGTLAAVKRLIFEAHTLVVADIKNKATKSELDKPVTTLAPAERETRIKEQRARLSGLRLRGEEECAYSSYDLIMSMLEKDALVHMHPEKFATRRQELQKSKPNKKLIIDQSMLAVREKTADLSCPASTELEISNALRRRALAFDLTKACQYSIMNNDRSELLDHLHQPPPPGYAPISIQQVLRADRAAFLLMSEKITSL